MYQTALLILQTALLYLYVNKKLYLYIIQLYLYISAYMQALTLADRQRY
jgi:hypothetical protein